MTSLNEDGLAEITNKDGEKVRVPINEHIIKDALHFKDGHEDLSRRLTEGERRKTFLHLPGKQFTFEDMAVSKAKMPLQYLMQHFNLRKLVRFTRPHIRVAYAISLAAAGIP